MEKHGVETPHEPARSAGSLYGPSGPDDPRGQARAGDRGARGQVWPRARNDHTADSSWRHVIVEYGGGGGDSGHLGYGCGPTDSDGLLLIHEWVPAAGMMIRDSTFRHSASGGIVSGWQIPDQLPNLAANNMFVDIASPCAVTVPSDGSYCADDSSPQCFVQ